MDPSPVALVFPMDPWKRVASERMNCKCRKPCRAASLSFPYGPMDPCSQGVADLSSQIASRPETKVPIAVSGYANDRNYEERLKTVAEEF